jgi:exodeoxyribonuclease-3
VKLGTWNVNSVRARLERLLRWLDAHRPDVLCLQELKVSDEDFPFDEVRAAGYHAAVHGQRTYNGVAILSREEPLDVARGFDDGGSDDAARLIAARVAGVSVVCVYVPNGGELGSDKWSYKLDWLRRLRAWLERHHRADELLALCGDLNVAPEARDCSDPVAWEGTVLYHPEARAALRGVTDWGLVDAFRLKRPEPGLYSWWDYRMLAFPKNVGLRIDHVFVTRALGDRCTSAAIDRNERKGKQPSDHAPVMVEFDLG